MDYAWHDPAATLAQPIIIAHHPHLERVKIAYVAKVQPKPPKAPKRDGRKLVLAKTAKVSPKMQVLMDEGYVFVITFDDWLWQDLNPAQQRALIDHELCHCGVDGDGYYLRQHDVEEFREIIGRHGFWKDDVAQFAKTVQDQLPLFDKAHAASG